MKKVIKRVVAFKGEDRRGSEIGRMRAQFIMVPLIMAPKVRIVVGVVKERALLFMEWRGWELRGAHIVITIWVE
jgi:hypothetical protein